MKELLLIRNVPILEYAFQGRGHHVEVQERRQAAVHPHAGVTPSHFGQLESASHKLINGVLVYRQEDWIPWGNAALDETGCSPPDYQLSRMT